MSLRLRAVLIAGLALLVLWLFAAALMIRGVQDNLDRTLDERLAMSARMVSGLMQQSAVPVSGAAGESGLQRSVQVAGGEGMACQVRSLRGDVMARTDGSPDTLFDDHRPGYAFTELDGQVWRTFTLLDGDYRIVTADRVEERERLTGQMLVATSVPFLIAVIGGLMALWIGIGRGLAPLDTLRRILHARDTYDFGAIDIPRPPAELVPVMEALNGVLGRLATALSSQRAFSDAAAHELRSPLTAIDTHLQVARVTDGKMAAASLEQASEGVHRLSRLLGQMLLLARTETAPNEDAATPSIHSLIRAVVEQLPVAQQRRIALSLDGSDAASPLPDELLAAAVRNLLENALHYSPETSLVEISAVCSRPGLQGLIEIADRGPGLTAEQSARVEQRFWRGDQGRSSREGAGLGLSIVRSVTERFGGSFGLHCREGGGLVARLTVPLLKSAGG